MVRLSCPAMTERLVSEQYFGNKKYEIEQNIQTDCLRWRAGPCTVVPWSSEQELGPLRMEQTRWSHGHLAFRLGSTLQGEGRKETGNTTGWPRSGRRCSHSRHQKLWKSAASVSKKGGEREAGERAHWLQALAALAGAPGLAPSTHMVPCTHWNSSFRGFMSSAGLHGYQLHTRGTHMYIQAKHPHT